MATLAGDSGDTRIIAIDRHVTANDGGAGGNESLFMSRKSFAFCEFAGGNRERTRSSRNEPDENLLTR